MKWSNNLFSCIRFKIVQNNFTNHESFCNSLHTFFNMFEFVKNVNISKKIKKFNVNNFFKYYFLTTIKKLIWVNLKN